MNYASSLVFSRILDPAGFGDLTALLALGLIVVVPTGAAQTVIAERVASYHQAGDNARVGLFARATRSPMSASSRCSSVSSMRRASRSSSR